MFHVLPLTADKVFQTMATTRHLSPSESLITGGGSHLLTTVHWYFTSRMAQLPRDTSQDTTRKKDPFLLSWHLWNVQENCCQHSSCTWALGQGHDWYPRVQYQSYTSTCTALHRSYANVVAKSSPFLITNVIVYAKLLCPGSDCLGPLPQPAHPWHEGKAGTPNTHAPTHEGRCKNLTRPKSVSSAVQAPVLWMQRKNKKIHK